MSDPVPVGVPSSEPTRRRRPGRWLAAIGLTLSVIAAVLIGLGISRFDGGEFTDLVKDPASALTTRVASPGRHNVSLSSGKYWVFAMGNGLSSEPAFRPPRLSVRGPGGAVAVTRPGPDVSLSGAGADMVLLYEFRAVQDGRYTLISRSGSRRVNELGVGDTDRLWDSAKQILGPVALIVVGGLIGLLGGILLLVAGILWITSRSTTDTTPSHPVDGPSPFG